MEGRTESASRAKQDAWRRFTSWEWPIYVLFALLSGGATAFMVWADFFWVTVVIAAGAYFCTIAAVRGVWAARKDVARLARLLDGLRGETVAARALDPEDEVPEGLALLILDNGLTVYVEGARIRFVRFFALYGQPLEPRMPEAVDWMTSEETEEGAPFQDSRPPGVAIPPELSRIALEWSLPRVEISFRVARLPSGRVHGREAAISFAGRVAGSTAFEVSDRGIRPAQIAHERDAIRDALDEIGAPRFD